MTRKITIGDPAQTGNSASRVLDTVFADAEFPLALTLTNHAPRQFVLPEIDTFLGIASICQANVYDIDTLRRTVSTIEQLAVLNSYALAITIEEATDPKAKASKAKSAAIKAGTEAAQ